MARWPAIAAHARLADGEIAADPLLLVNIPSAGDPTTDFGFRVSLVGLGGADGTAPRRRSYGWCAGLFCRFLAATERNRTMKVRNSLKSLRARHRDNRIVRRKGRVYIINKTHRKFKARQG